MPAPKDHLKREEWLRKKIEAQSGEKNHFFGKHHTEEAKRKNRIAHIGKIGYWRGKKRPNSLGGGNHLTENGIRILSNIMKEKWKDDIFRQRMSIILRKSHPPTHNKPHSEETKEKLRKKRMLQKIPNKYTQPELKFQKICEKYALPYKYTGNSTFWIGNVNPDFVNINGEKTCVEIWGDYWHTLPKEIEKDKKRLQTLEKYGWKRIELWESELKTMSEEEIILKVQKG